MALQFFLQYPDFNGPEGDMLGAGPISDLARAAERLGWDGFSLSEHPAPGARWLAQGGHQTLDPFVALGGAATVTERIRLLTFLAVLPYRNPLLVAKAAATVDRLSGGRFVLGAGTGYLKGEFRALGTDFDDRNQRFDEALDALPLHWSGEPFDYEGKHWSARQIQALPRPIQQPIPIWLGGNARITRERVAARCQGWMPLQGPSGLHATARTPSVDHDDAARMIAEITEQAAARRPQRAPGVRLRLPGPQHRPPRPGRGAPPGDPGPAGGRRLHGRRDCARLGRGAPDRGLGRRDRRDLHRGNETMSKRIKRWLLSVGLCTLLALPLAAEPKPEVRVYKSPSCGCCVKWVDHLEANGFQVTAEDHLDMASFKESQGLPRGLESCHTALVDGYVIEGHVPASDVLRLLKERPDLKGLAVPGMPIGSPGMEGPNPERYSVIGFGEDGERQVFSTHGP